MRKFLSLLLAVSLMLPFPCVAQNATNESTTPEPYGEDEFSQFMKDVRRAEIISLGSLPFVTLTTTLVYSGWRWGQNGFDANYFPNPFAKSSDSNGFSQGEQIGVLLTSLGISAGIGLTDLLVNVIRRGAARRRAIREQENAPVIVTPIDEVADAVRLELPEKYKIAKARREALAINGGMAGENAPAAGAANANDLVALQNGAIASVPQNAGAANASDFVVLQNGANVPQNAAAANAGDLVVLQNGATVPQNTAALSFADGD